MGGHVSTVRGLARRFAWPFCGVAVFLFVVFSLFFLSPSKRFPVVTYGQCPAGYNPYQQTRTTGDQLHVATCLNPTTGAIAYLDVIQSSGPVIDASLQVGADGCAQISNAITTLGGVTGYIDARRIAPFNCGSTVTVPAGVFLQLNSSISATACPAFLISNNSRLSGLIWNDNAVTTITDNGCAAGIVSTNGEIGTGNVTDLSVHGNSYVNANGTTVNGGWIVGSFGFDFRGCALLCRFKNLEAGEVETGIQMSGYNNKLDTAQIFKTKWAVNCGLGFPGGSMIQCNSSQVNHIYVGASRYALTLYGFDDVAEHPDVETSDILSSSSASISWTGGLATITLANHGFNNGDWVSLYSPSTGFNTGPFTSPACQVTVTGVNTFTCPAPAGTNSATDLQVDASITYSLYGSILRVNNNYTETNAATSFNSDPSGLMITNVSKSGSTITFTTAAPLSRWYYQTTFGTPTAGGSGYVASDVGKMIQTATGCQTWITGVSGGAVTGVFNQGFGSFTCATGTGQATTGGSGSGATLNITAIAAPQVGIYSLESTAGSNWDMTCDSGANGAAATVLSATTFSVSNASLNGACSTFTPNYPLQAGAASFVSANFPGGNVFDGGTPLLGVIADITSLEYPHWVTHDNNHRPYIYPLNASKICFGGTGGVSAAFGPCLIPDGGGGFSFRTNTDTAYGNITAANVAAGGGSNIIYRCATAGAVLPAGSLTITAGACGSTTDTGLRVK